jgi:hypothetical protein
VTANKGFRHRTNPAEEITMVTTIAKIAAATDGIHQDQKSVVIDTVNATAN